MNWKIGKFGPRGLVPPRSTIATFGYNIYSAKIMPNDKFRAPWGWRRPGEILDPPPLYTYRIELLPITLDNLSNLLHNWPNG